MLASLVLVLASLVLAPVTAACAKTCCQAWCSRQDRPARCSCQQAASLVFVIVPRTLAMLASLVLVPRHAGLPSVRAKPCANNRLASLVLDKRSCTSKTCSKICWAAPARANMARHAFQPVAHLKACWSASLGFRAKTCDRPGVRAKQC